MKVSYLIKVLQECQKSYGDLDVQLATDKKSDTSEQIFVDYLQYEDKDVISIQDFPY